MTARRRNLVVGVAAVVVVMAVVALLVANRSSGHGGASAASPTTAGSTRGAGSGSSTSTTGEGAVPTTTTGPTAGSSAAPTTTEAIPLQVAVSQTSNLHDGQGVTVTVTADAGSDFYGLDARLCAAAPAIANFYDYTPDPAGHCILHPLSGDSDAFLQVPVAAPYHQGSVTFRVGVGTDHFTTEDLTKVAITCGPGHPCQLVVRLQYPHGFGFRTFPLTYAG